MLGYSREDIYNMIESVGIAYEIIDGPADLEAGLEQTIDFLTGLLTEGHVAE